MHSQPFSSSSAMAKFFRGRHEVKIVHLELFVGSSAAPKILGAHTKQRSCIPSSTVALVQSHIYQAANTK